MSALVRYCAGCGEQYNALEDSHGRRCVAFNRDPMTRRAYNLAEYIYTSHRVAPYVSAEVLTVRAAQWISTDRPWPARVRLAVRLARAALMGGGE